MQNEILTVGKLKEILDSQVNDSNKDNPVVIHSEPLSGKAMLGCSPHMTCYPIAYFGFDWDTGRFFIQPSETLYFKDDGK